MTEVLLQNKPDYQELNPTGEHTIVLVGGATEGIVTQQPFADALASDEHGFRVISYDYTQKSLSGEEGNRFIGGKVDQLTKIIDAGTEDAEKVNLFAHSLGTIVAIDAALHNPDKVDRIILANPAGLFEDSFPRLVGRFTVETVKGANNSLPSAKVAQKEGSKYMTKHLASYLGDAIGLAHGDIRDKLVKLQELGISVDLLLSANDRVFPWRLTEEYFASQDTNSRFPFNSVSSFFSTELVDPDNAVPNKKAGELAGHGQNIHYPEETARLVRDLIEQ